MTCGLVSKPDRKMSILVMFDDDEVRQYNGETRAACIRQAKERCKKLDVNICSVIDCESSTDY